MSLCTARQQLTENREHAQRHFDQKDLLVSDFYVNERNYKSDIFIKKGVFYNFHFTVYHSRVDRFCSIFLCGCIIIYKAYIEMRGLTSPVLNEIKKHKNLRSKRRRN